VDIGKDVDRNDPISTTGSSIKAAIFPLVVRQLRFARAKSLAPREICLIPSAVPIGTYRI